jgi:DNA-binding NtrC family response regulator
MDVGHKTSIVFVEDEALICDLVNDVFAENGFEVHTFLQAEDALRYITSGEQVDVLFTDINLPGEMDGAELATRARELRPDLPIIYASGRYSVSDMLPLVTRSIFVKKPYDPDDMCTLVSRLASPQATVTRQ